MQHQEAGPEKVEKWPEVEGSVVSVKGLKLSFTQQSYIEHLACGRIFAKTHVVNQSDGASPPGLLLNAISSTEVK